MNSKIQPQLPVHHSYFKNAHKVIWLLILMFFLLLFIIIGIACWHFYRPVQELVVQGNEVSSQVKRTDFYPKKPTIIKDSQGHTMKVLTHTQSIYIPYQKLNRQAIQGLIATEDKRFYIHHGVDLYGVSRSIISLLRHQNVQGGSTITQQLVKNVILKNNAQVSDRKIKEMVIAQNIEKKFSKKQILEFYLNDTDFGHGNFGIGSAAQYYFSKDQRNLSLPEVSTLIAIVNNPSLYDPQTRPQAVKQRRDLVLYNLYRTHRIKRTDYNKAIKTPLIIKIKNFTYDNDISQNYALSFAINKAIEELMRAQGFMFRYTFDDNNDQQRYNKNYGIVYQNARQQLLNGGYTVNTTINQNLQNQVQQIANKTLNGYNNRNQRGILEPQLSMTLVDNATGNVLAIVGGRTTEHDSFNRAYQGYRQPGSAAKVLVSYPEAFERGYTPDSTVLDSSVNSGGHIVRNWGSSVSNKVVTLRQALEQSLNTVAVKLAIQDQNASYYSNLSKMEFSGLTPQDKNPIISIGGFTQGVTTTEMAGGYSTLARDGNYISPTNIDAIEDTFHHRLIYQNDHVTTPVFTKAASYMTLNMMQGVLTAKNGTGQKAQLNNYKYTAGKTGTTDDNKDSYFVGMTPKFTLATWVGNDKPQPLSQNILDLPQILFKNEGQFLVGTLHQKNTDFPVPNTIAKNGSTLSIVPQLPTISVATKLQEEENQRRLKEIEVNDKRLSHEDYESLYHSNKPKEKKKEQRILKSIKDFKINLKKFYTIKQYLTLQNQLKKIQQENMKIKQISTKTFFNNQIIQLNQQLEAKRAWIKYNNEQKDIQTFSSKKQKIINEHHQKQQARIDELQKKYQQQLTLTQRAYANNSADKETQKHKLEDLINQIRSYGGNVDNPTINIETD